MRDVEAIRERLASSLTGTQDRFVLPIGDAVDVFAEIDHLRGAIAAARKLVGELEQHIRAVAVTYHHAREHVGESLKCVRLACRNASAILVDVDRLDRALADDSAPRDALSHYRALQRAYHESDDMDESKALLLRIDDAWREMTNTERREYASAPRDADAAGAEWKHVDVRVCGNCGCSCTWLIEHRRPAEERCDVHPNREPAPPTPGAVCDHIPAIIIDGVCRTCGERVEPAKDTAADRRERRGDE